MDIADVAKQSGLKPSTLRYYEDKGLITAAGQGSKAYAGAQKNKRDTGSILG